MAGPFPYNTATAEEVWDWLLIPNPPNSMAAQKLLQSQSKGLAVTSIAEYEYPEEIFSWDIAFGGAPRFE